MTAEQDFSTSRKKLRQRQEPEEEVRSEEDYRHLREGVRRLDHL